MPKTKVVGILGGMGPHATAAFFQTLLKLTPARKDWDHLRVIIDNNPHIPSRSRHLIYGEPSPVPRMLESCRKLESYPVDIIVLPCNSASIHVAQLQAELAVPLLNIIEIAAAAVRVHYPQARRIAALGGRVTYATRSYEPFLRGHGMELVDHGEDTQREVEQLIEALKLGVVDDQIAQAVTDILGRLRRDQGIDAVVLACTEFGCLASLPSALPLIDSSYELAKHTVRLASA